MEIGKAIALVAVSGRRRAEKLLIGDGVCDEFPRQITVEGVLFNLAEEEEVDPQSGYFLAHYFRRV